MQKWSRKPVAGQDSIFPCVQASSLTGCHRISADYWRTCYWHGYRSRGSGAVAQDQEHAQIEEHRSRLRPNTVRKGNWGPVETKSENQRYRAEDESIPHSLHLAVHYWQVLPGRGLEGPVRWIWCDSTRLGCRSSIDGRRYNRGVRLHKIMYEALMRLAWQRFVAWIQENHKESKTNVDIGAFYSNICETQFKKHMINLFETSALRLR